MPHRINWTNCNFEAEFFGEVSAAEIDVVNMVFCGDDRFDMVRTSIWDMSRITKLTMELSEIEYAAAIDKGASKSKASLKGAIVVPGGHVRQLVESYLSISNELDNEWDTRLFDNIESARKWIES
ncbi:MAG: hypothetical protein WBK19_14830 [Azonexus sp.]